MKDTTGTESMWPLCLQLVNQKFYIAAATRRQRAPCGEDGTGCRSPHNVRGRRGR